MAHPLPEVAFVRAARWCDPQLRRCRRRTSKSAPFAPLCAEVGECPEQDPPMTVETGEGARRRKRSTVDRAPYLPETPVLCHEGVFAPPPRLSRWQRVLYAVFGSWCDESAWYRRYVGGAWARGGWVGDGAWFLRSTSTCDDCVHRWNCLVKRDLGVKPSIEEVLAMSHECEVYRPLRTAPPDDGAQRFARWYARVRIVDLARTPTPPADAAS